MNIDGNHGQWDIQVRERYIFTDQIRQEVVDTPPADAEAGGRQAYVHKAHLLANPTYAFDFGVNRLDRYPGGVGRANQSADARPGDQINRDSLAMQHIQHADMA